MSMWSSQAGVGNGEPEGLALDAGAGARAQQPAFPAGMPCYTPGGPAHSCPPALPPRRYDKYCPFYKSVDMLRNMIAFYECANEAVERTAAAAAGAGGGGRITYNVIKARLGDLLYKLRWAGCCRVRPDFPPSPRRGRCTWLRPVHEARGGACQCQQLPCRWVAALEALGLAACRTACGGAQPGSHPRPGPASPARNPPAPEQCVLCLPAVRRVALPASRRGRSVATRCTQHAVATLGARSDAGRGTLRTAGRQSTHCTMQLHTQSLTLTHAHAHAHTVTYTHARSRTCEHSALLHMHTRAPPPPSPPRRSSQKFEDPAEGEEALKAKFRALNEEIRDRFRSLEEEYR